MFLLSVAVAAFTSSSPSQEEPEKEVEPECPWASLAALDVSWRRNRAAAGGWGRFFLVEGSMLKQIRSVCKKSTIFSKEVEV